jgi:hypothetical protein
MSIRAYPGVDPGKFPSGAQRQIITTIDAALRSISAGLSQTQPTSSTLAGGVPAASFVTINNDAALANERRLVVVSPLSGTDGGPGGAFSLALSTTALAALLGGTPANTYGTTFLAGSATTFVRTDDRLKFPTALMSAANSSLLTLTDNATDQILTGSLGNLNINPTVGLTINLASSTSAQLVIRPDSTTAASLAMSVIGQAVAGNRTLLAPGWLQPTSSDIFSSQTFRSWDVNSVPGGGQHTSDTWVGYDISSYTVSPHAGSGAGNKVYGFRGAPDSLRIGNSNATYDAIAMAYFAAPSRTFGVTATSTVSAGIITEPAIIGGTKQVGLLVQQRTAGQTATDRLGIDIEAQNSGTNRWGLRSGDRLEISSPAARATTVLLLHQLATGGVAGAHVNFDDKAGDPPAPVAGDLWRNGDSLWFRQAAASVDLTAASGAPTTAEYVVAVADAGLSAERVATDTATIDVDMGTAAQAKWNVIADSSAQRVTVRKNSGADVGTRTRLNLIEGSNVTMTVADDAGSNEVDITINASVAGGGLTLTEVEKDLGTLPRYADTFDITGLAGLTAGKQVLIVQKAGPYTGKGDRQDEAEMDQVSATGYVVDANTIRAYWVCQPYSGPMSGNVKFGYAVSG